MSGLDSMKVKEKPAARPCPEQQLSFALHSK